MNKKKSKAPLISRYMHPRNPYKIPPSFKGLAIKYPDFRSHCVYDVSGKVHLDFQNPAALIALTTALLDQDFNIQVEIPNDRLVPTLPLRLNYLLWIEDLLMLVYPKSQGSENCQTITGCDVGTGASCVYPLVGVKKFGWHFIGTESDQTSYISALSNVKKNCLEKEILIKKNKSFFDVILDEDVKQFLSQDKLNKPSPEESVSTNGDSNEYLLDFTVCNPPFFSTEDEMVSKNKNKKETRSAPVSAPTGSIHEKVVEGGEVSFISKMIDMSPNYKDKIRIFTSMIGQKKSVKILKRLVEAIKPAHYTITEFCQGRTMRWGIAWTFDSKIVLDRIISKKKMSDIKPLALFLPRSVISPYNAESAWKRINLWLKELKLRPRVVKKNQFFISVTVKAYKETWLHQRKKRRELIAKNSVEDDNEKKENLLNDSSNEVSLEDKSLPNSTNNLLKAEDKKYFSDCILKCSINVKQNKSLLIMEMALLGGTKGKDAMNQLLQFMKNKLIEGR